VKFENRNYAFAGAFVDELARSGLRDVCICPGSRSSPLAISFARHSGIRKWTHLDERSAGFFALGMARNMGRPVAMVCSSGTASANFLPAVAEARYGLVPLIVLTADRPPELVNWGALQTIDQTRIYGDHVKLSVNAEAKEVTTDSMAYIRTLACKVYATSSGSPEGPVHVNFPFREPLEPSIILTDFPEKILEGDLEAWHGRVTGDPFVLNSVYENMPNMKDLKTLASYMSGVEHGLIVCGTNYQTGFANLITKLASKWKYPIFADALSGVRVGSHDRSMVLDTYDAYLRDDDLSTLVSPDLIIRFGPLPVSKSLAQYLEKHKNAYQVLVDEGDNWRDPFRIVSQFFNVSPVSFCEALTPLVNEEREHSIWSQWWMQTNLAVRQAIERQIDSYDCMFEGKVFSRLSNLIDDGTAFFVGNSMPVRDLDTFYHTSPKSVNFVANRGASGIDGVVSSALGIAAAGTRKVVLVIGDISLYHDMNGLLAAKLHRLNATIVVLNNNGGGIFSFLPQADHTDFFEEYFGTPHGLNFRSTADLYGLNYSFTQDWNAFDGAVNESLSSEGISLIEIPGDRVDNVELHGDVWNAISETVKNQKDLYSAL
jgi:2-succinyl-5-enolpyruvyl-6-hydroxy-3-cyclohexene-1-carboxylate synthase